MLPTRHCFPHGERDLLCLHLPFALSRKFHTISICLTVSATAKHQHYLLHVGRRTPISIILLCPSPAISCHRQGGEDAGNFWFWFMHLLELLYFYNVIAICLKDLINYLQSPLYVKGDCCQCALAGSSFPLLNTTPVAKTHLAECLKKKPSQNTSHLLCTHMPIASQSTFKYSKIPQKTKSPIK